MSVVPADRRRDLPDEPGVYLFRDAKGKVIYVGKAKSIKKRVGSHFSNPSTRAGREILEMIDQIEALVVQTESEALLVEQNFIKQYKPRLNIRLRDDKSYPYIAISLDEDFPRVYFTRERHRRNRAYFGPYSNAKRVRATLEVLGKVFLFRSCEGPEPGRRSGSPCLDYFIKRCEAPCVGYVSKEQYRQSIDGVIAFLSGRYKEVERRLDYEMRLAAAEQRFEDAARERNRLRAIRSLLERQRVAHEGGGSFDAIAVAINDGETNAQVFQVRDGVLSDRQSFYLDNASGAGVPEVAEAFILQYYASAMTVPPLLDRAARGRAAPALAEALTERRGAGTVEIRAAERGDKRRILELAERNARLAIDQEKLRSERRRQQRVEALDGLQRALGLDTIPLRIECFDISTLMGTNTVASMVVFEGGAPKKSDYRRFRVVLGRRRGRGRAGRQRLRAPTTSPSMEEMLGRRLARWESPARRLAARQGLRPQLRRAPEPGRDRRRQGPAGGRTASAAGIPRPRRRSSSRSPSGSRRCSCPGAPRRSARPRHARAAAAPACTRRGPPLRHHPPPHQARPGDDRLDSRRLPGVGPARKRALLAHFGSPDAILAASREELESVPGLTGKLAREIHRELHKTGV